MSSRPANWDSIRKRVYKADNYTCQNCGTKGGPLGSSELHAHHGVPLKKGGTNKMSNLTTYCRDCHHAIHRKKAVAPTGDVKNTQLTDEQEEWAERMAFYLVIGSAILIFGFSSSMDAWFPFWIVIVVGCLFAGAFHLNSMDK